MNNIRNDKLLRRFGERVKAIRQEKELSQAALANEARIPLSQIGRIERGEVNATLSTVDALAKVFGMTISELVDF